MATGRGSMLGFVGGVGVVHLLPAPLPVAPLAFMSLAFVAAALVLAGSMAGRPFMFPGRCRYAGSLGRWGRWLTLVCMIAAFTTGLSYGSSRAAQRLADALDPANEDKVTRVVLRVAELPRLDTESRAFVADVLSSVPEGVPSRIQVRWNAGRYSGPYGPPAGQPAPSFPEILPGQVWRMALVLRSPHGSRNPHGFDYEGHVFAQGIRATGTVRGKPVLLRDEPWAGVAVAAQRARHIVREAMLPYIGEQRWGGVLLALAIGDQASVSPGDGH